MRSRRGASDLGYLRSLQNRERFGATPQVSKHAYLSFSTVPRNIENDETAFWFSKKVVVGGCRGMLVIIFYNH